MPGKVTKLTRERAFATVKVIAWAMLNDEKVLTYSELARRLGMPNETGQGLGPVLNEAAVMCSKRGLPNVASVIVTKESMIRGQPFPSLGSFVDGEEQVSGLTVEEVPIEQERVRTFDWRAVRELGLA